MNEQTTAGAAAGRIPRRLAKDLAASRVRPNLLDYDAVRAAFNWDIARESLAGLPGGGLNIAHEAVDHHLGTAHADRTAIHWIGKTGARRELSYRDLAQATNRFANALHSLGVQPGERVFVLMGRLPELHVAVLGALKAGCVVTPLFSAFGPEPIATRCEAGDARVLVTTPELYRRKVAGLRERLPGLRHVIVVGDGAADGPGVRRWGELVDTASAQHTTVATDPDTMALLHFTSGTTGRPKGAIHVHDAVLAHAVTGHYALDLHDDDVYWCTADPGWVTGTSYGIIAPLVAGVTNVVVEAEFDATTWYSVLEQERVTVWYTAPTAIRMMMKLGSEAVRGRNLSALRFMASVGEPLNPEAVVWGLEAFGLPFHDNWWQTETGGIMISNYLAMAIKPGSMGKPLPGIAAAIVRRNETGHVEPITDPDVDGELALKTPWPSMMRGYLHEDERYRQCFADGWYLTGDLARVDADGYYWFVGRADDVIKSAGHLIGPFEGDLSTLESDERQESGPAPFPPDAATASFPQAPTSRRPTMAATYELNKSSDGQFRFALKGDGGETLLNSEGYAAKPSAQSGIASVQANCAQEARYEKKTASNGKAYFNLKSGNHQVIGTSPMHATDALRDAAIAAVQAGGATTVIKDNT